jgi:hypothetical protein
MILRVEIPAASRRQVHGDAVDVAPGLAGVRVLFFPIDFARGSLTAEVHPKGFAELSIR